MAHTHGQGLHTFSGASSPSLGPLPCPRGCLSSVLAPLSSAPPPSAGGALLVLALPVLRAAYRIVSVSITLLILTGPSVHLWLFFSLGVMSWSQSRDEDRDPDPFQGLCLPLRAVLRPPSSLRRAAWRTATRCLQSSLGVLEPDPEGLMGTRGSQAGHVGKNFLGLVKACALDKQGPGPGAEKCVTAGKAGPPGPEWLCSRCLPGQCSPGQVLTR